MSIFLYDTCTHSSNSTTQIIWNIGHYFVHNFTWHHTHSQTLTLMHPWQDLKYAASQCTISLLDRVGIRFVSWKALRETSCLSTRIASQVEIFPRSWPRKWIYSYIRHVKNHKNEISCCSKPPYIICYMVPTWCKCVIVIAFFNCEESSNARNLFSNLIIGTV